MDFGKRFSFQKFNVKLKISPKLPHTVEVSHGTLLCSFVKRSSMNISAFLETHISFNRNCRNKVDTRQNVQNSNYSALNF